MSNILTDKELIDITGAKTKDRQIKTLIKNNIAYVERIDGWPRVTWHAVYNANAANDPAASDNTETDKPDFSWSKINGTIQAS